MRSVDNTRNDHEQDLTELARLFAIAYIRLLESSRDEDSRQNPLDSLDNQSDELSEPHAAGGRRA